MPSFPSKQAPHETPDRYIGDFNNANQTNLYTVASDGNAEDYTALFAGAGFRYAQLSGLPAGHTPSAKVLTALRVHSDVAPTSMIKLPVTHGSMHGTPNVLKKIHDMTVASQTSNLWSIPTE